MNIKLYNRYTEQFEQEKVYGEAAVEWLYGGGIGSVFAPFLAGKWFSKMYGSLQDTSWSQGKVLPFIENFNINMDEYETTSDDPTKPFSSFNDFFIRKFKPGKREFATGKAMAAPAEARYFGSNCLGENTSVPVKGKFLNPLDMIKDSQYKDRFVGGPFYIARLCPVDYHRYHYPDNGKTLEQFRQHGPLHSVNPLALKFRPSLFLENEREVSILETENFGLLAYIEVGAICVGKIVQSHKEESFGRGAEKGYFLFGGSTVIVLGELGKWELSDDIVNHTRNNVETYIHLGDEIAQAKTE